MDKPVADCLVVAFGVVVGNKGAGVLEVVESFEGNAHRAVHTVRFASRVYALHAFQKKSHHGIPTDKHDIELATERLARGGTDRLVDAAGRRGDDDGPRQAHVHAFVRQRLRGPAGPTRVRELVAGRKGVTEKAMFGGLAFLLDGKMFCGVLGASS